MALSTKSFRGPTREELLDKKQQLETELATVDANEKLTRRRELVEALAACYLPDATEEHRRLAAAVADAQAALELAKKNVRIHDGGRQFKAVELQERKKIVLAELVGTANPKIQAAIAGLESEIRQHEHQAHHGAMVQAARQACIALEQMKLQALTDAAVETAVAKILKPITFV